MKSNLTRWVSPWDPRGVSVWGAVATLALSVGLWRVNGTLPEVWPNRCSLLRGQLEELVSQSEGLNVIAESVKSDADRAALLKRLKLWELNGSIAQSHAQPHARASNQETWIIPRGSYVEARVKVYRPRSGESTLLVELITQSRARVTSYLSPDRELSPLFDHLVGSAHAHSESKARVSQYLRESDLRALALKRAPGMITCQPERAERELVMIAALMLKDEGLGLKRAWRFDDQAWLTERVFESQRQRRLYQVIEESERDTRSLWLSTWQPDLLDQALVESPSSQPPSSQPPAWISALARDVHQLRGSPATLNRLSSEAWASAELTVNARHDLHDAIEGVIKGSGEGASEDAR